MATLRQIIDTGKREDLRYLKSRLAQASTHGERWYDEVTSIANDLGQDGWHDAAHGIELARFYVLKAEQELEKAREALKA